MEWSFVLWKSDKILAWTSDFIIYSLQILSHEFALNIYKAIFKISTALCLHINQSFFHCLQLSISNVYYFLLIFSVSQLAFLDCLYCFIIYLLYNVSLLIFISFNIFRITWLFFLDFCDENVTHLFIFLDHKHTQNCISHIFWFMAQTCQWSLHGWCKIKPWDFILNSSNC